MRLSRLKKTEWLGLASALLLVVSLFLPWFGLTDTPERAVQEAWVCGAGSLSCTGWETYPVFRWVFIAAASAPLFLAYFIASAEHGSYPTGEFTMTIGFAVVILVLFNGAILEPGSGISFGISLKWGWFVALAAGLLMSVVGVMRSLTAGGGVPKKPPATF